MKIQHIAKTNEKGQIVIPKDLRDELGISDKVSLHLVKKGPGIYIYPVSEVIGEFDTVNSYLAILEKTQGSWGPETVEEKRREKAQKKMEQKAARLGKQQW
ncbi:MAG: hypothetical protein A3H72_00980 [Candidatus Doudnabacteria bacterium RIFCSPLOWO2_02_FULL_48_8]|uniref:SpoVT-AbrB domain-containing protein n=1 Tax=Candidatus Doudnabacteria bacterium RIFCSPHIGHO2_01_FULL_46_24 TaxID=1817825 RepID=A0A1F5NVJ0_9BACT|nr:MAG: hypothetical protein A2720_00770 [Candidatus Doudnabacteria bacterium RIFCSPHIGHO2_01_FULL_46_24]OGE95405.1 MAG: hypothetical protein A3H72_00980 [Candidatus Doudnabacteria bacterium RIFCSPLOWO2_02_FULL_48_8]OGE96001.1 MAG: hypothetical protein A3E98_04235 [Candidatus Doudnabacteria bacterium RIFCSPHIGHO2_12_FULL_48_11]